MGGTRYLTGAERVTWVAWLPAPPCIRTVYDALVARATVRRVPVDTFIAFIQNEYGPVPQVRTKNFLTADSVWRRFDLYLRNLEEAAPATLSADVINFEYECGLYGSPEDAVQASGANLSAVFRCAMAVRLELPALANDCKDAARRQLIVNPYLSEPLEIEFGEEVIRWIKAM